MLRLLLSQCENLKSVLFLRCENNIVTLRHVLHAVSKF